MKLKFCQAPFWVCHMPYHAVAMNYLAMLLVLSVENVYERITQLMQKPNCECILYTPVVLCS